MTISGMTVQLSDGASVELVPEEVVPPAPTPTGTLWYLKSWFEIGKTLSPGDSSNFCALGLFDAAVNGTSGQDTWLQCDGEEIELIQRVNNCAYGSDIWHYLVAPSGRIYRTVDGADPDTVLPIRWPRIAIGSKGDNERNQVMVLEISNNMARIAGIPHSTDYGAYNPITHPWLFHRDYCMYLDKVIGDSPKGILYMPLFDANDPAYYVGVSKHGMWIPTSFLHSQVGVVPQPSTAIVHELYTSDDREPIVAHIYRIDLTRVTPFVTPSIGVKLTPSQFQQKYNMDLVINGDGGPWLSGPLVSAGRWMSKGSWYSQITNESSVWFDSGGHCRIAYGKPVSMAPWNVISGPKQMIKAGAALRTFDDTFIAARSAFGLFDDTHACVLAIEGEEFTGVGATEQDLALLGLHLGLRDMLEFDSGGSTGVVQRYGVSYSVENRPVLNALCFKAKN